MPDIIDSLFDAYTQTTRLLRLTTPLGPDRLLAEAVHGEEDLDGNYAFTISALSLDAGIPLRALIGQPALLELLTADGSRRPFHGHVTAAAIQGANGGMARYALTLAPWTTFLAHTRDSRIFQDKNVFAIIDAVFKAWHGRGLLAPAWRFDIADMASYPIRSLCTQYRESDLAFVRRLLAEEGLFAFFDHAGDVSSPALGCHRLVVADHNGACAPNAQARVRFTQPGAVMAEDSIDRWRRALRLQANAVELQSWNYRTRDNRPVAAASLSGGDAPLVVRDVPGQYAYPSRIHGERKAERMLQALEAGRETFTGAGTVRTLAPGTTFMLSGHAVHDGESDGARTFLVTRVIHRMHNNLAADVKADIARRLSEPALDGALPGERAVYRNRIDAIRADVPYRTGLPPPRPTVRGQHSAIVVGPPGAPIHTDRDHRVKVQFHWQRGSAGHNRLDHPAPDSHAGAPGDDTAGTWIRVATPLAPVAGANWGSHALPRVGQEVLVDFLEGDIDRPVIIGALYNGAGARDAQHNRVAQGAGAATGNAPTWFPGEEGAHAHPAVFSGLKSQALQASQDGSGAYSQLLFDDSPGQARVALQRHVGAYQGTDELNLGHLRHQAGNQRLQTVGFGAELKTRHSAALRAGRGLLLTSDARPGASGSQMDAREAMVQIDAARDLADGLAQAARQHNALAGEDLPAVAALQAAAGALGDGTAFAEPQLQLSSPKGIIAVTPADAIFGGGATGSICAGQDIDDIAQGAHYRAAAAGINLFTYGKANAKDKPNQETGIRLHAASGTLSSQSQAGETHLTADKAITVASVDKAVTATAKTHLLLTAQGAMLKLEGGDIMLHCPGKVEFKAGKKELAGPASGSTAAMTLPTARDIYNEAFVVLDEETKEPMRHVRYRLESDSGITVEGVTDALGRTQRLFTPKSEKLTLYLLDN
nr:type VI secretion system tip protein TssI/VgrG [uncultured Massilia sp.]